MSGQRPHGSPGDYKKPSISFSKQDIQLAMKMLDANNTNNVSLRELCKKLQIFYPSITLEDVKTLMGDEKCVTLQFLENLLLDNTITGFDPVAESFKVYDPEETGKMDPTVIKYIFENFNSVELLEEDHEILQELLDFDKDGTIGVEDFRKIVTCKLPRLPTNEELGRPNDNEEVE